MLIRDRIKYILVFLVCFLFVTPTNATPKFVNAVIYNYGFNSLETLYEVSYEGVRKRSHITITIDRPSSTEDLFENMMSLAWIEEINEIDEIVDARLVIDFMKSDNFITTFVSDGDTIFMLGKDLNVIKKAKVTKSFKRVFSLEIGQTIKIKQIKGSERLK